MDINKTYKNKKVLVTGHTGFKGAWLTEILLQWGAEVYGYSLEPNTDPNLFTVLKIKDNVKETLADIRNYKRFCKTVKKFKPDIIFHLAAQPLVRDSYDDPLYTYETNTIGTANVLEAMRQNETPVGVIITTDKVYRNFEKDIAYKEDDHLGGHDPYSNSKACADLVIDSYIKSYFSPDKFGKDHSTLVASARSGNVIGGGDWARDRLIPDAIRAFLTHDEDLIVRSPNAIRPWQHVFEPLFGYLLLGHYLLKKDTSKVGAWNFGPKAEDMQTVANVLGILIAHLGKGRFIIKEDLTKHEANNLKLDNSKAMNQLDWKPKFDLNVALLETSNWYMHFYQGKKDMKKFSQESISKYFNQ